MNVLRQLAHTAALVADVVALYDTNRVAEPTLSEWEHRQIAISALMTHGGMDETAAAILLADALARRAANKLKGE